MANIFLSYSREDLAKARQLAAALEKQGWSVFWDRTALLAGQDFEEVIEQAIEQAGCMIVAWSKASKKSDWVRGEANIGRERKILVPILFDDIAPPIAFRALHTENFAAWKGETDSPVYLALCKALTERIESGNTSAYSVSDKTSPHSTNKPEIPKMRWSKQLTVKVGKITVITATLAILLWYLVPGFISQKEVTIPVQATSVDLAVTNKPLSKESEIQSLSAAPKIADKPLIKEPDMVRIPDGNFQMGSNYGDNDEKPVHSVRLKSFAIGRYEVTFDEYDQFAEAVGKSKPDDEGWGRGKRPVINVSWKDATAYKNWLSEKTGKPFRLPTEAEWEYAARAGTKTDYYWDDPGKAEEYAWFAQNKTQSVGQLKPNTFKLYDMSGNVLEWVQDCYEENYNKAPKDGSAWEPQNCVLRVLRGGSWSSTRDGLRSAFRDWTYPGLRLNGVGFRLAQD